MYNTYLVSFSRQCQNQTEYSISKVSTYRTNLVKIEQLFIQSQRDLGYINIKVSCIKNLKFMQTKYLA